MFPLNLSDFYSPLTPQLLILSIVVFLIFEIAGHSILTIFKINHPTFRISHWFLGFGIYCLVWFLINTVAPLDKNAVLISAVPFVFFIPLYVRTKGFTSLVRTLLSLVVPFVLLMPTLPNIWVRASLPPYLTDEMAYQFISPQDLTSSTKWEFSGGLYQVIPKNLNILFHTTFALTNTYAVARLIHFGIFLTALLVIYSWLKNRFGRTQAVFFWLMTFYVYQPSLIESATSGYVDIGTASFALCMIIAGIEMFLKKDKDLLPYFFIFGGLSVGSKYSALFGFVAWFFIVSLGVIGKKVQLPTKTLMRNFILMVVLFVSVGGFWYIKNLVITGNPIYPFLFGCRGSECIGNSSFFGDWTTRITINNIPTIFNDLLVGNRKFEILAIIALLLCAVSKTKKLLIANLLIVTGVLIEFGFMRLFSGFLLRYFWHLQFVLFIFISLQTYSSYKDSPWMRIIKGLFTFTLGCFLLVNFVRNSAYAFNSDRLPRRYIKYAIGQDKIIDWTRDSFPQMHTVVEWCDSQKTNKPVWLYRVDPDLVWFTFEGQMRVYMTNCRISDFGPDPKLGHEQAFQQVVKNFDHPAWFASLNPCQENDKIQHLPWETEHQRFLRRANNNIICNLKEVRPHLYYYEP